MPPPGLKYGFLILTALAITGIFMPGISAPAVEPAMPDDEAAQLGHRIQAIQAAIADPMAPDAMQAVMDLGLDSRYYVMVRGWLSLQLQGDLSIAAAKQGEVSPKIEARIEFLERAIRAIDLE